MFGKLAENINNENDSKRNKNHLKIGMYILIVNLSGGYFIGYAFANMCTVCDFKLLQGKIQTYLFKIEETCREHKCNEVVLLTRCCLIYFLHIGGHFRHR